MGYRAALLLALVASASAGPVGPRHSCARSCSAGDKFSFEEGTSYEYNYEVETATLASAYNYDDKATVSIHGKATVGVIAPCEYVLSLSDMTSDANDEMASHLTKSSLRFGFDDGKITDVCGAEQEEDWVLNFKRGVLTTFQNSMKELGKEEIVHEVDVTGDCDTAYTIESATADTTVIKKSKPSSKCSRTPTVVQSTLPEAVHKLPIISADQDCTQTITEGIIVKVECQETLAMRPLATNEDVATTVISTKLTLRGKTSGIKSTDFDLNDASIVFDAQKKEKTTQGTMMNIQLLLNELHDKSTPVMTSEVPALFSELVDKMRSLEYDQLRILFETNQGLGVHKFLVDAAPMVATASSTKLVTDLIKNKEISTDDAEVWFTSLNFIRTPEKEMFASLSELLRETQSKNAILGASALVKNYCKTKENCIEDSEIFSVLSTLEDKLGSACRSTDLEEKETILAVLRSLGMVGRWTKTDVLANCFEDESNPDEVRVAAINVWRAAPCSYDRTPLQNVYSNVYNDPELRINAYLSLMACPTQEVIDSVKQKLEAESVNQVGAFVWSHLSNLQESASNDKQWIRELIGEDALVKKFNTTSLQLSRNIESSFYMEEVGAGATFDSNIIFSSKSFLPRSAMVNFTVDVFGESINLLEIGGRFEGFEIFAEKFFGPNGYYPEETVEAVLRGLRQGKSEETTIEDMLDVVTDEPEGSYYMRILGNDYRYHHFRGIENFFDKSSEFDLMKFMADLLKSGQTEYTKSYQIIDTELTYPTLSGLPLKLKLNGSATIGLKMDGQFMFQNFRDFDINGHVYPSAAVEIDALMMIDSHFSKSGVKMTSNGQTSLVLDGSIKVEGNKVVDITVNMPEQKKIELMSVKTQTVFFGNNVATKLEEDDEGTQHKCLNVVDSGVEMCYDILNEPLKKAAALYVVTNDNHNSYRFKYLKEDNSLSLLFDTPNSDRNRKLFFSAMKNADELKLKIETPWKTIDGTFMSSLTNEGPSVEFEAMVDYARTYKGGMEMKTTTEGSTKIMKPKVYIQTPNGKLVDIGGRIELNAQENSLLVKLQSDTASLKLTGTCMNGVTAMSMDVSSGIVTLSAKGLVDNNNKIHSQLDIEYSIMNRSPESLNYLIKLEKTQSGANKNILADFMFKFSKVPTLAFHGKQNIKLLPGKLESESALTVGNKLFDLKNVNVVNYGATGDSLKYNIESELTSDTHNIDMKLTENFELRSNYFIRESVLTITPTYKMTSLSEIRVSENNGFATVRIELPHFKLDQKMTYTKVAQRHYTAQIQGNYQSNNWEINGVFKDQSSYGQNVDMELSVDTNVNGNTAESYLKIKTGDKQLTIDARADCQYFNNFVKLDATRSSFSFDTNIGYTISLRGKANLTGTPKSVEVDGIWNGVALASSVAATPTSVEGSFECGTLMKKFRGEITRSGATVELHLSPTEKVTGTVNYNFDTDANVKISVETPFTGYENQELAFSFMKISDNDFTCLIKTIWKNAQIIHVDISGNMETIDQSNTASMNLKVTCDKEYFGFEEQQLKLSHKRIGFEVDSILRGSIDGEEYLNGQLSTSMTNPMNKELKAKLNGVEVTISDTKLGNQRTLNAEGNVNGKKYAATIVSTKDVSSSGVTYDGSLRVIRPYTTPITGSWKVIAQNPGNFVLDFEITRFWTNYGNIKVHTNVKMTSVRNSEIMISLASPDTRFSFDSAVNFEANDFNAHVKTSCNGMKYSVSSNGSLDFMNKKYDIKMTAMSQDEVMFKLTLNHQFSNQTYATKANIVAGIVKFNVSHVFNIKDAFNWMHKLDINTLSLINEMVHQREEYMHTINWVNENRNLLKAAAKVKPSANTKLETTVNASSYLFEDFESSLLIHARHPTYKSNFKLNYGSNVVLETSSVCECLPDECSVLFEMSSSFTNDIRFDSKLTMSPMKQFSLSFTNGEELTTITSSIDIDSFDLSVHSTKLVHPFRIESRLTRDENKRTLNMVMMYGARHESEISLWNSNLQGNISIKSQLPLKNWEATALNVKYNFATGPRAVDISLKNNVDTFSLSAKLTGNSLTIDTRLKEMVHNLISTWNMNAYEGDFKLEVVSPSRNSRFECVSSYNVMEKSCDMTVTYGSTKVMSLKAKITDNVNTLEATFYNRVINVTAQAKKYINMTYKNGDKEITLNVTMEIENMQSPRFLVTIKTFWEQYASLGASMTYDISQTTKKCAVKMYKNEDVVSWEMETRSDIIGQRIVSLNLTTPFMDLTKFMINLDYNFARNKRVANINMNINEEIYKYALTVLNTDTTLNAVITSSQGSWSTISINGNLYNHADSLTSNISLEIDSSTVEIVTSVTKNRRNPKFNLMITSPYNSYKTLEFNIAGIVDKNEKMFEATFRKETEQYVIKMRSQKNYKQGDIFVTIATPIEMYKLIGFQVGYNFLGDFKTAEMKYTLNEINERFTTEFQINDNNVMINIKTPIQGLKEVTISGDLTHINGKKMLTASLQNEMQKYSVLGELNEQSFNVELNGPEQMGKSVQISGQKTMSGYLFVYKTEMIEHVVKIDYMMHTTGCDVTIVTPFQGYEKIMASYSYDHSDTFILGSMNFQKGDVKFAAKGEAMFTETDGTFTFTTDIPIVNKQFGMKGNYNLAFNAKTAEVSILYDNEEHKLSLSFEFDHNSGIVRFSIPFINETVGVDYKLNIDRNNKVITAELNANTSKQSFNFAASVNYSIENFSLKLETPFDKLHLLKIESQMSSNANGNKFHFLAQHNLNVYSATALMQPEPKDKIIVLNANIRDQKYMMTAGFDKQETSGSFNFAIDTPIENFKHLVFEAHVDASGADKVLRVGFENENMKKLISIKGKLLGDLMDFEIETPFNGFENFETHASLNRNRRSAEFSIMNDGASGSIRASFNSLSIKVTTPYGAARQSSFLLEKPDQGGLTLHYQRGDNVVDFKATPAGRKRSFNVTLKSAIPGWEFLALAGRLDKDDLIAYLSGQRNEAKMTVEGGGKYSRIDSDLKFTITTPYTGYENVQANLKFNRRRNDFKLDIRSSSSNFKIMIKSKPNLTFDIFVPNAAEPTVIKGTLSVFNGKLNVNSRFRPIRTFELVYNVEFGQNTFKINSHMERNGIKFFRLDFNKNSGGATLSIHGQRHGHHSAFNFKRIGFQSIQMSFERDGMEFKVEANGTGNLPVKGGIDFVINNSFRAIPRTVTGNLQIDRSRRQKTIKMQIVFPGNKLYQVNVKYSLNLRRPNAGTYEISITTPDKRARVWNNISGSWNLKDHDDAKITFDLGGMSLTLQGKLHLKNSKFVITSSVPQFTPINVEWRYSKQYASSGTQRDHFMKVGSDTRFVMLGVKGTSNGLRNGDAEYQLQASRFMRNPLNVKVTWNRDSSGLTANGSFQCGSKQGQFKLNKLKREASTRSMVLDFTATTNIPGFTNIKLNGEYSFNNGALFKLNFEWDVSKVSINFDINDITNKFTQQSVSLSLPSYGDVDITFGHDFRNKKKKYTIVAQFMGRTSFLKAEWTRNKSFTKLKGNVNIDSMFIGKPSLSVNYDVTNINDAKAKIEYKRGQKFFNLVWKRKLTAGALLASVDFTSSSRFVPSAKINVDIQFTNGVNVDILLQRAARKIHLKCKIEQTGISGTITTPYRGFEQMVGSIVYDLSNPRTKTVTVRYQRGNRKIDMDLKVNLTSARQGSLEFSLNTPFRIARTLTVSAQWNNGQGEVHYKRNNIEYHFTGEAEVQSGGSSFDITLRPTNGNQPIRVALTYNAGHLIRGGDSSPRDIGKLELEMLGKRVAFELKGFRNSEKIYIDFSSESTFEKLRQIEFKLDSELSTRQREGMLEITVNDFHFKVKNHFEQRPNNGYYWRSEFDSSVTSLPGLIVGVGRQGEARIVTIGTGEDKEITVEFTPKQSFKNGFSGKLSLPRRGIHDAAFDVDYRFANANQLDINVSLQLQPGRPINAAINYNSDGVQARLSSRRTGARSMRVRRSATETGFLNEIGFGDYHISLKEDFETNIRKGLVLEGEMFGKKFSIESLLKVNGVQSGEGKFMIMTTFNGYEKLGGIFTYSNTNRKIMGKSKLYLPSSETPAMLTNIDFDMSDKLKGEFSVNFFGQLYEVKVDSHKAADGKLINKVNIITPYHAFTDISIDSSLHFQNPRMMEGDLKVSHPLGSMNAGLKYDLSSTDIMTDIHVELKNMYETPMLLKFKLDKSPVKMTSNVALESAYLSSPMAMGISWDLSTASNIKFLLTSTINEMTRTLSLELSALNTEKSAFNVFFAYKGMIPLDGTVQIDLSKGINTSVMINSPQGKYTMEALLEKADTGISLLLHTKCPKYENKFTSLIQKEIISENEKKLSIELFGKSSMLSTDITYKLNVACEEGKKLTKHVLTLWGQTHTLVAGYSCSSKKAKIALEIESPMLEMNQMKINCELNFKKNIKALVDVHFNAETHTFEYRFNQVDQKVYLILKSALIKGGMIKIDGSLTGVQEKDIDLIANLRFDEQAFGTKFNMKAVTDNEMSSSLQIKTPFRGFRKINMAASFESDEDSVKAVFTADKPMHVKITLDSTFDDEKYNTLIDIVTPMEELENVRIMAEVPLNKTAPKLLVKLPKHEYGLDFEVEHEEFAKEISAMLNVNGEKYGAGMEARYKAPYELAYFYQAPRVNNRFHVMMDSSVFNVVSLMA